MSPNPCLSSAIGVFAKQSDNGVYELGCGQWNEL
jgi:hypothetical protein